MKRTIVLNLIILSFYMIGQVQSHYNLGTYVSVIIGICSALFSIYLNDKMEE